MAFDLDPFADILPDGSVKNVRAGGKFQPKAKLRPRKESSASNARVQPTQTVTVTHELAGVPPGNNKDQLSGIRTFADDTSFHLVNPSSDLHSCFGRSEGENTDIFIGWDSFDDFLSQSTPVREAPNAHVSGTTNTKGLGVQVPPPVDDGARDCSAVDACIPPEPATLDPLTSGEAALSIRDESFHVENSSFETEFREVEALSYLETLDVIPETNGTDAIEAVSCLEDDHAVPSPTKNIDEGPVASFVNDDIIDFSSMQFSDSSPTDRPYHIPVFEEPENSLETPHADATVPGKDNQRARRERRKSSTVSGLSTSCQEDVAGGSLGRRRKRINTSQLIDESADEGLNDEGSPAECPGGSNMDEDYDDEDYQVENESEDRKVRRKSRNPVTGDEKFIKKRKKADASSDQSCKAPKKFSHSTRRNRRQVDKALLNIPEDEVDFQRLPIRDLILLAEHNERITNKEATTSGTQRQSTANTFTHYNEDDAFASEEGRDPNNVEASPVIQEVSTFFNYQTYMDKTPIARWSKQDTELFYEAVRQFGTDLSMIQQLFPGRTRRQIKLKYKKEERQQPLRLREALTTRTKDHSHFELVIERLRQIAAEKRQNSNRDESDGIPGEQAAEKVATETNEEVDKSEQFDEETHATEQNDTATGSPLKPYDFENDYYGWSPN